MSTAPAQTPAPAQPGVPVPEPNNNTGSGQHLYNLDDKSSYEACYKQLKTPSTGNFGVRFDKNEATCAIDLTEADVVSWLEERSNRRSANNNQTLWLNFWASGSQRDAIKAIARKYDLSPRLTGLLCPPEKPARKTGSAGAGSTATTATNNSDDGNSSAVLAAQSGKTSHATSVDVEKGVTPTAQHQHLQQPTANQKAIPGLGDKLSFGDVVDDLWHFNSVDFGSHYIYVGFNALFTVPDVDDDPASTKPAGIRIWSSLLICDDGTLVSVFQRPDVDKPSAYAAARRNVLNVFKHLSTQHDHDSALDALMKVRVRWYERSKKSEDASYASEAASLLFYYLFDDWLTTYALIARRAHPYRDKLELLRQAMFVSADVNLVSQIHNLGRQLTVLKLMYQSFEHIVSRLLHWQRSKKDANLAMLSSRPTFPPHSDPAAFPELSSSQLVQDERIFLEDESDCRVKLFSSSIVRFERLLGRIRLYALTEIEECLKEKESLVLMVSSSTPNFLASSANLFSLFPEFQLGRAQGVPGSGEVDENNHPSSQGYHPLSPGQFDDGLLLHSAPGNCPDVLDQNVLAEFFGGCDPVHSVPPHFRRNNSHC